MTGTKQRATVRPQVRCVGAVGENHNPICAATELRSCAELREMHRWNHVGDNCNELCNVMTEGGSLHIERLFYSPFV